MPVKYVIILTNILKCKEMYSPYLELEIIFLVNTVSRLGTILGSKELEIYLLDVA